MAKTKRVAVDGGQRCPGCRGHMQRYSHGEGYVPAVGKAYFRWWDLCHSCGRVQHYPEARVEPGESVLFVASAEPRQFPAITGTKHVGPPEWAGNVVDMIEHQGRIYVACQQAVFRLNDDQQFEPLMFLPPGGDDDADA